MDSGRLLRRRRWRRARTWARIAAGWTLIGLGLVGLALPVLQGLLFLLLGGALLAPHVPAIRALRRRLFRRFPSLRRRAGLWRQARRAARRRRARKGSGPA